jgi:hypothetical protein
MTSPPDNKIQVPRSELHRLFIEGGWQARLNSCKKIPYYDKPSPAGGSTLLFQYKDGQGMYIALICYHKRADGSISDPHPKMLLIDSVWHYV